MNYLSKCVIAFLTISLITTTLLFFTSCEQEQILHDTPSINDIAIESIKDIDTDQEVDDSYFSGYSKVIYKGVTYTSEEAESMSELIATMNDFETNIVITRDINLIRAAVNEGDMDYEEKLPNNVLHVIEPTETIENFMSKRNQQISEITGDVEERAGCWNKYKFHLTIYKGWEQKGGSAYLPNIIGKRNIVSFIIPKKSFKMSSYKLDFKHLPKKNTNPSQPLLAFEGPTPAFTFSNIRARLFPHRCNNFTIKGNVGPRLNNKVDRISFKMQDGNGERSTIGDFVRNDITGELTPL